MPEPLRVLCVCTHNRTRSVIMAGLLGDHLTRCGIPAAVTSAGTAEDGSPAMERAVKLLAKRGIDVTGHRSRTLTEDVVHGADLILTAERAHVVYIAGLWPDAFGRTFTLPELILFGERVGARSGMALDEWSARVAAIRPGPGSYLDADEITEIRDPTGRSPFAWRATFAEIDDLTARLAKLST